MAEQLRADGRPRRRAARQRLLGRPAAAEVADRRDPLPLRSVFRREPRGRLPARRHPHPAGQRQLAQQRHRHLPRRIAERAQRVRDREAARAGAPLPVLDGRPDQEGQDVVLVQHRRHGLVRHRDHPRGQPRRHAVRRRRVAADRPHQPQRPRRARHQQEPDAARRVLAQQQRPGAARRRRLRSLRARLRSVRPRQRVPRLDQRSRVPQDAQRGAPRGRLERDGVELAQRRQDDQRQGRRSRAAARRSPAAAGRRRSSSPTTSTSRSARSTRCAPACSSKAARTAATRRGTSTAPTRSRRTTRIWPDRRCSSRSASAIRWSSTGRSSSAPTCRTTSASRRTCS